MQNNFTCTILDASCTLLALLELLRVTAANTPTISMAPPQILGPSISIMKAFRLRLPGGVVKSMPYSGVSG